LAAAGGIDLPQAATIAANAMNQFALKAQQLPKIADLIAGAANASAIDVSDFGHSLQQVGAVAHLAGFSFQDTALAITAMGNAGIKGSDAGTSLKTFLQNLQPTTKKASTAMSELGIITSDGANRFFDATGKIKSMAQVSQVLQNALRGQTQEQKLATLQTLFGSDAIRAAAIIANQGAAGFNNLAAQMNKITAAQVAAKRMDTLKGSIEQMKGSAQTAAIIIGTALIPQVRKMVDAVTGLINRFGALTPAQQAVIINMLSWTARITAGIAAVILLTRGIIIMVTAIRTVATAIAIFNTAMGVMIARAGAANASLLAARLAMIRFGSSTLIGAGALNVFTIAGIAAGRAATAVWAAVTGPIGIAVGIILLLAGAAVFAYNNFVPFHNLINQIGANIQSGFNTALAVAKQRLADITTGFTNGQASGSGIERVFTAIGAAARFVYSIWQTMVGVWNSQVVPVLNQAKAQIQNAFGAAWAQVVNAWQTQLKPALIELWNTIQTQLVPALRQAWQVFQAQLLPALKQLWTALQPVVAALGGAFVASFIIAIQVAAQLATLFISSLVPAIQVAAVIISALITVLGAIASFIIGVVLPPIVRFITFLISGFSSVINFITGTLVPGVQAGFNGFMAAVNAVVTFLQPEINLIVALFNLFAALVGLAIRIVVQTFQQVVGAFQAVFTFIGSIISGIGTVISAGWNIVVVATRTAFNAVKNFITGIVNGIVSTVRGWINNIISTVNGIVSTLPAPFRNAFNSAKTAVSSGITGIIGFVKGIPGKVTAALGNLGSLLYNAGASIIKGLINGIQSKINEVTGMLNHLTSLIQQAKGPPEKDKVLLQSAGVAIMQSLINGFDSMIPSVLGRLNGLTFDIAGAVSPSVVAAGLAPVRTTPGSGLGSTGNIGPTFEAGSITVNAPQNMSPGQVADQVARQISYKLSSGATVPNIPGVTV
jgi:TP901 family phage tail tape measure protein